MSSVEVKSTKGGKIAMQVVVQGAILVVAALVVLALANWEAILNGVLFVFTGGGHFWVGVAVAAMAGTYAVAKEITDGADMFPYRRAIIAFIIYLIAFICADHLVANAFETPLLLSTYVVLILIGVFNVAIFAANKSFFFND